MSNSSRDLLHLEHKSRSTASPLESTLLVCKKDSVSQSKRPLPDGKIITNPVAKSQVMGKVKDFLGVISEANKRLKQLAKDNAQNYDIEVLTGTESEVIEMDLMLGIADLHTPEAVSAAESAISSGQPLVSPDSDNSETESEGTSDDDDYDDDDDHGDNDETSNEDADKKTYLSIEQKKSNTGDDDSSQGVGKKGSKKGRKIIEMC